MDEKLHMFQEMIKNINFPIPKNTSTNYYISVLEKMIQDGCEVIFQKNIITIQGNGEGLLDNIIDIKLDLNNVIVNQEIIIDVNSKKRGTNIIIHNHIKALRGENDIFSEIEELEFNYLNEFYRYDYIRKYEENGTCIYHSSKDLTRRTSSVAKMFDKGLMISSFYIKDNLRKTVLIPIDFTDELKKTTSEEIKKGKIFEKINSKNEKEIPYKPYPFNTNEEFEKALYA